MKKARPKKKPGKRGPSVRLPLPARGEARHGDRTKYDRAREKERLRREVRVPHGTE
jgi:hypothetical protein